MEALLVSLYGYRSVDEPPPGVNSPPPSDSQQAPAPFQNAGHCRNHLKETPPGHGALADPTSQTSVSSSSSSSVADDWIVEQLPGGPNSEVSLLDEHMAAGSSAGETSAAPEVGGISAEDWSRGTALVDPATKEPLQPVQVYRPPRAQEGTEGEDGGCGQASPGKRTLLNAITHKRAALTAYDLLGSRAVRAPLSPAALFEQEARGDVLREKPAASLQEVSHGVNHRWKNLGEEERKK